MPKVTPQFKAPQRLAPTKGGPLPRRKPINQESPATRAAREQRADCRSVVLARDNYVCQFHRIAGRHHSPSTCQGWQRPNGWQLGAEVHEVITRARAGDPLDPDNCVTLCPWANNQVDEHQAGAELLGLLLPSWASTSHEAEARARRRAMARFEGPRLSDIGWPSWRRNELGSDFEARSERDLAVWGIRW